MPIQDITTALMAENNLTQNDILYMETKSIFVQLIRSIPSISAERNRGRPLNLPAIAERAATAKDATLVRKGIKVKEMLRELEELKLVDRRDGYKLLTDEVNAELTHLGSLREKVVLETRSLEAVFKTIGDHNNYLRSQLEQYKAYLQNVRLPVSGFAPTCRADAMHRSERQAVARRARVEALVSSPLATITRSQRKRRSWDPSSLLMLNSRRCGFITSLSKDTSRCACAHRMA